MWDFWGLDKPFWWVNGNKGLLSGSEPWNRAQRQLRWGAEAAVVPGGEVASRGGKGSISADGTDSVAGRHDQRQERVLASVGVWDIQVPLCLASSLGQLVGVQDRRRGSVYQTVVPSVRP